jgi:hypothetical protein
MADNLTGEQGPNESVKAKPVRSNDALTIRETAVTELVRASKPYDATAKRNRHGLCVKSGYSLFGGVGVSVGHSSKSSKSTKP